MIGKTFGRLIVLEDRGSQHGKGKKYLCKCSCGADKVALQSRLLRGETKSCGCLRRELASTRGIKHGLSSHRLYKTWNSMMQRCCDPTHYAYNRYGGRGITVCQRWHDVRAFIQDNNGSALPGLSIDRIDNDGNYEPGNCRWVQPFVQNANRANSIRLTYDGKTLSLKEWSSITKISVNCLQLRLQRHWSVERALTTPPQR